MSKLVKVPTLDSTGAYELNYHARSNALLVAEGYKARKRQRTLLSRVRVGTVVAVTLVYLAMLVGVI